MITKYKDSVKNAYRDLYEAIDKASEGAIQINVTGANSPDYDAEKLAEMIMEKIKRKANIKRSLNYGR